MKGVNFMIEVAISILILSLSLFFLLKNYPTPEHISKYKFEVFQYLSSLDEKNNLRKFAVDDDAVSINNSISKISRPNIKYSVVIYNKTSNTTEMPKLEGKNIAIVDYIISGDFGNYSPRKIKVFLWD
jgi:hypothetical protein